MVSTSPNIVVQEKEVQQGYPSFSKYTISAADPQAALSASVSISSTSYGQSLVVPVTLIHVADHSAAMQGQKRRATLVQVTMSWYLKWSSRVRSQQGSPKTSSVNQLQLIFVSLLCVLGPLKRSWPVVSSTALFQQLPLQSLPWRGATLCTASSTPTRWCSSLCSHCWLAQPSSSSVGHLISRGKNWSSLKYS